MHFLANSHIKYLPSNPCLKVILTNLRQLKKSLDLGQGHHLLIPLEASSPPVISYLGMLRSTPDFPWGQKRPQNMFFICLSPIDVTIHG